MCFTTPLYRHSLMIVSLALTTLLSQSLSAQRVRIRLEATNEFYEPVSEIAVGDSFNLRAYAEDLRNESRGVFAAYMDIVYDPDLVEVGGAPVFSEFFPNGPTGDFASRGRIEDIGAFGEISVPNQSKLVLFDLPMQALAAGHPTLLPTAGGDPPMTDILVHGENPPIPVGQVEFVGSTFVVVPEPAAGCLCLSAVILLFVTRRGVRVASTRA